MKILIIDDSLTSRLLLQAFLNEGGYDNIVMAESAESGLEVLKNSISDAGESNHRGIAPTNLILQIFYCLHDLNVICICFVII